MTESNVQFESFDFHSWPHRWFGIFTSKHQTIDGVPEISRFIDDGWEPKDFSQLVSYLRLSPTVLTSSSMPTPCIICGKEIDDPGSFQSDGVWLWPHRLTHYLEEHAIRLPDTFVDHIRAKNYQPPNEIEKDVTALPWPRLVHRT